MRSTRLLWSLVLAFSFIALTTAQTTSDTASTSTTQKEDNESKITSAPTVTKSQSGNNNGGNGTTTRKSTKIGANVQAGGVSMITPSVFDAMQLYPIGGEPITWVYNYTSVLVAPTAVNIGAFCSGTQQYYTIANNYSYAERQVVWDTKQYEERGEKPALAMETYQLIIYDSNSSRTAIPSPGHLGAYNGINFALYTPRGAVPWSEYKCPTCNSASSLFDGHAIRVLMGSALLVAISFAWFIHGAI
ncbi:hypothetical protein DFH27DRAFT_135023 [Peziza echinospora]|nr:hypothetical protein DFH27DRAFT_135023 [Peziza echinospora]